MIISIEEPTAGLGVCLFPDGITIPPHLIHLYGDSPSRLPEILLK